MGVWKQLQDAFELAPPIPSIPAYSEFMPPPYVAFKPSGVVDPLVGRDLDDDTWRITEFEEFQELRPGLIAVAQHVLRQLEHLSRRERGGLSHALLDGNPAWPPGLASHPSRPHDRLTLVMPLALSRTQDDKGRVRWTLFGASHHGPHRAVWQSFAGPAGKDRFDRLMAWSGLQPGRVGIHAHADDAVPALLRQQQCGPESTFSDVDAVVTFIPFERLPTALQAAYLQGRVRLWPSPESQVFFHHPGYACLDGKLPLARQIPLLQLFARVEGSYGIRIPQSGWLDERPDVPEADRRNRRHQVRRTHRWERVERRPDQPADETRFDDRVTVALFSSRADDLNLYGKPMARNAQIWTDAFEPVLHGPTASWEQLHAAAMRFSQGGRYGYRFFYPPMMVGSRAVFWHRPVVAQLHSDGRMEVDLGLNGYVSAECDPAEPLVMQPRVEQREHYLCALHEYAHEPGHRRFYTADNVRKVLEWSELLDGPLSPALARHLVHTSAHTTWPEWLERLSVRAAHPERARALAEHIDVVTRGPEAPAGNHTYAETGTRAFEEKYWKAIAHLCEGDLRDKNNADVVDPNVGRRGGDAGKDRPAATAPQLELVGSYLHRFYRDLIQRQGMTGVAECVDHVFSWDTGFDLGWSANWRRNRDGLSTERNVVMVIPGRNRGEAVVMGDHYDTAYMEDLYEPGRGGDRLRASARGADDNHSATAALQLAAEVLLPLSRAGKLERDVWLVHLTGEEFPADCLGARNVVGGLLNHTLRFTREDGSMLDVSNARVVGAFILDMIAHNNDHQRDVFQIAPGEGKGSARLARRAHQCAMEWNRMAGQWNLSTERAHAGRAQRVPDGSQVPPLARHAVLHGEVRPEWDARSALYNTDGQIFSDHGIPVVLFMENYDIRRAGYHDMHDTMKNIDLDYGAALAAIAIETVTDCALAPSV